MREFQHGESFQIQFKIVLSSSGLSWQCLGGGVYQRLGSFVAAGGDSIGNKQAGVERVTAVGRVDRGVDGAYRVE